MFLNCSGCTIVVKWAFGHSWENCHHWILSVLVLHVDEVEDVGTIRHEHAAQEKVDEIHLANDIDKVEKVAEEVLESIAVVHSSCLPKITDQMFGHFSFPIFIECFAPQSRCYFVHLLVLKDLPQIVGNIEHHALNNIFQTNMVKQSQNAIKWQFNSLFATVPVRIAWMEPTGSKHDISGHFHHRFQVQLLDELCLYHLFLCS